MGTTGILPQIPTGITTMAKENLMCTCGAGQVTAAHRLMLIADPAIPRFPATPASHNFNA